MLRSKLQKLLAVSVLCTAFSAVGSEPAQTAAAGGCAAPAAEAAGPPTASAVELPDYSASSDEDDSVSQAAEAAALTVWAAYVDAIADTLGRSGDPRDWAFAAIASPLHFGASAAQRERADALLARAVKAAPDDVLVQWIAARVAQERDATNAPAAAARLQHLEPDNAAAFVDQLGVAARSKDEAAVDKTLATMSTATRFELHYAELLKGLTAAYSRVPRPVLPTDQEQGVAIAADALPFTDAMATVALLAMPPFQHLLNACRTRDADGSARSADCAAVGRLLAHSDTILGHRIGYAVLRVSHTYTADDEASARGDDWVYSNYIKLIRDGSAEQISEHQQAWLESSSEIEVIQRLLNTRGVAPAPPDGWDDDTTPFSAQRLAMDAEWLDKHPVK